MEDSGERTAAPRRRVDRLSTLTDDVLIHILSFLPTKFASGTSILSTRWKNLADKVVDIDLDDSLSLDRMPWMPLQSWSPTTIANFALFVRKVLFSRIGSTIRSFRLSFRNRYDYHLFDMWIQFVLLHNVRDMTLDVKIDNTKSYPVEIFTCKTLEVLRLIAAFDLSLPPANFNLVNLKVLRLEFIIFNDDESIKRVLSGCPVLQELRLYFCKLVGVYTLEVCIPSLKNLSILYCYGEYHVILDTPNLENFLYGTRGDLGFSIKHPASIVNAEIGWGLIDVEQMEEIKKHEDLRSYGGRGIKVINSMNNVKSLCLQGPSLTALYYSESSLATFGNLTRLELGPSPVVRDWWSMPDLLACCPNLEALIFSEGFICGARDIGKEFRYRLPQSVPVCFTSSLKVIKIGAFHGQECEFKIVEYFLAHVAFLTKMVIGTDVCEVSPFGSKRKGALEYHEEIPEWVLPTCKRLSKAPRCLKTCQILVSWTELLNKSMRILI